MCAGKQELLDSAVLALNYGVKYGLVGRNGVGKTTLLRHLAEGLIPLPRHLHTVHVEQELEGDGRTPLQAVLQADGEREWLLATEQTLVDGDEETEKELGITLNEVYERLEELDSDNAEARAAQLLLTFKNVFRHAHEWEAAVEAQLARLRSFADEVTSVHLMANTTREVTVYARRRCTDGGVGALPVEAVPAAAAAAG